jgi:aquaporin Z
MNKYIVEFIGTFFLVLVIGLTVLGNGAGAMAPLAIGSVLMVMVYAGGGISGAHYNPAVTLAVWLRGKCETKDVASYMAAQVAAAVVAAILVGYLKNNPFVSAATPDVPRAMLNEFLFTFALAYVVLTVATSKRSTGNSYYGLAIGFTLLVGVYAGGAISGGAYNPAVAVGITVMGLSAWSNIWIFLVANFAGGAAAAVVFKITEGE